MMMSDTPENGQHVEPQTDAAPSVVARLRAEIETLRELLVVNEQTAADQTRRADQARSEELAAAAARDTQTQLILDLIRVARDGIIVLDGSYVVTYMNERAEKLLSVGEALVGQPLAAVFPGIEGTSFWGHFRRVLEHHVPVAFEEHYPPRDRWYSVNAAPVGKGMAIFFRDISDRRIRDEALARTEKLAAVGRMASSISHEINNPLESVTNLLYLIENSVSSPDEMRTYAQLAASELARVSHIVTQTLKFHRQSTRATETRASEILESVLSLYQSRFVTLHTVIHRDYDDADSLMCFAGDMRQVFANLVGNALDATGEWGSLWLRTRAARSAATGETGVRVTVADNGAGMSKAVQQSVFEAFFTTKGVTGSGLGLWVSEEIVRTHRGVIHLRSRDTVGASGTVFSIFFPTAGAQ